MSALRQDVVYALRSLRKQPGFTAVAIAMLAIGIGATVAIFALTFAVLYKPLPFPDPSRLMLVHLLAPDREAPGVSRQMIWSYPKYRVFRDHQRVFESSSTFTGWTWKPYGGRYARAGGRRAGGRDVSPVARRLASAGPIVFGRRDAGGGFAEARRDRPRLLGEPSRQ